MAFREGEKLAGIFRVLEISKKQKPFRTRELHCASPLIDPSFSRSESFKMLDALVARTKEMAKELSADRIVLSYPPATLGGLLIDRYGYLPVKHFGFQELNVVGQFLDLRKSEQELSAELDSKCRNMIRRAQKESSVAVVSLRADWDRFYDLNTQTLGALAHSRRALEIVWEAFIEKGHAIAIAVKSGENTVSATVASIFNGAAYYWMGFNSHPRTVPGSNNLALWELILECKRRGANWFNLGSMEFSDNVKQNGISEFKSSFGGRAAYTLGGRYDMSPVKTYLLNSLSMIPARFRRGSPQIFRS